MKVGKFRNQDKTLKLNQFKKKNDSIQDVISNNQEVSKSVLPPSSSKRDGTISLNMPKKSIWK
jgi:hypothetical protein